MKAERGYFVKVILVQMLLLPLLITVGSFVFSPLVFKIIEDMGRYGFGKDTGKLLLMILTALPVLLFGLSIGYLFSRQTSTKPGTAKSRYLPPIIPILYALIFAVLAASFSKGDYNSDWWAAYIYKNPSFFIFDVILALSGMSHLIPVTELIAYTGFALGFLLQEKVSVSGIRNVEAVYLKGLVAVACIAVIAFTGFNNKAIIDNAIIELLYGESTIGEDLTEYDLQRIAPFREANGLASLGKEASLKFEELDSMPRLDGATAAYPVYAAFVEAVYKGLEEYYTSNKDYSDKDIYFAFVESDKYPYNIIKCSKTEKAYERLINGETDIIFVAEPSKEHVELIKSKGDDFVLTPIGYEAFVFFTNVRNPVENLTIEQIQDIYSGKIDNWREVGGQNRRIVAYQRPENSGSQTVMVNKVMKNVQIMKPTEETLAGGMGAIIKRVASYKNAKNSIGYSFMYYSSSMMRNNQIKYLGINGVKPNPESVRSKTYPFTVPVYAVTLESNTEENVTRLIDWILTEEGQSLIEKTGYIPVK